MGLFETATGKSVFVAASSKSKSRTAKSSLTYQGPRSTLRTLQLIERIAAQPEATTLAQLSQDLEMPKSSLLGLLRALTQNKYLQHESNNYALGPSAHRLAMAIIPNLSLPQVARPIMRDLAVETGETVVLSVLDAELRRAVYVDKAESASAIRYTVPIGTSRPLYCSAAGRILLAFQSPQWILNYLSTAPFPKLTDNTITDVEELRSIIMRVKRDGYATTFGETSEDVAGFSAAVFDIDLEIAFALNIGAPLERGRKNAPLYIDAVRTAAEKLSLRLGSININKDA